MSCPAVECLWWVWERVWKSSLTQESNVAACGFLISCGLPYCGWRWYVFLRKGLSRPFCPPHTHTTDPHPTTTLSWSAPAPWAPSVINYTNCIDLKVKEDNTSPCFVLRLWISLHSLCVCECGFSRKRKMRIIQCQQPWGKSPVLALLLERLCITAKFYVHHSRDRSLMQDRTIEECSEFVEFEHVDGSKYCEFKKKKKATCQQDAVTHEGPLFTLAPSCHPVCREV